MEKTELFEGLVVPLLTGIFSELDSIRARLKDRFPIEKEQDYKFLLVSFIVPCWVILRPLNYVPISKV